MGGGEGWRGLVGFGWLAFVADAKVVGAYGDGIAGDAVDFHVFAGEAPIPGGHEDGLGFGVAQDDRAVVVDARVDVGFVGLADGGDAQGGLAVHEDGHEIGAVAAEVEEGAGAVLGRVGEPGEPFGADADLLGTFVAVVDDDFAEVAELAGVGLIDGVGVAGVPGGLVVDEDVDVVLAGGLLDGEGVAEGGCERLFDHGGDAVMGGEIDDAAVIADGGVDENGVRVLAGEHLFGVGVEELGVEVVAGGVAGGEGGVGLDDGDETGVAVGGEGVEESADVAVNQADDGDADGLGWVCGWDGGVRSLGDGVSGGEEESGG